MRTLLALARRRRSRSEAPGDLRALRAESLRPRRAPAIRVMLANLKRIAPWLAVAAFIAVADQASKHAIGASLRPGEVREITGFFNLVLAYNRGAAFSFLSDAGGWQRVLFIGVAAVAVAVIVALLARHPGERLFCAGLALILGGALGNVWDRVALGYVLDFLGFQRRGFRDHGGRGAADPRWAALCRHRTKAVECGRWKSCWPIPGDSARAWSARSASSSGRSPSTERRSTSATRWCTTSTSSRT